MKYVLFLVWLTPATPEVYTRIYAEPGQCSRDMQTMASSIDARTDTQMVWAKCVPVAPGMLEAVGA